MDHDRCAMYDHLLTRKCSCGGDGKMIVDFVADFIVRCSKCHLSTHAYIDSENAAKHWNDGDDIMDTPLHIFWDDPEGYLQGEITGIYIDGSRYESISPQSCLFDDAIFEYTDRCYSFEHVSTEKGGSLNIGEIGSFNHEMYRHTVKPADGETICFDAINYTEAGDIGGITFRWNDTKLSLYVEEYGLMLTRSALDPSGGDIRLEITVQPALFS